jgi:Protein kinase domain
MMDQKIGKYRILERIGRGGMGSVYKAHDPVLDRLVALKVVSAETDHTDELRARFFREAQACAKLSHPNIVTIHDLGEADGHLFIVMELLEGEELRQLIARRAIPHLEDKFPLMLQICEGLEFAHDKGIVHRDVKPANIYVLRNGQVKILDFGIAHIAAAQTGLTRAGLIVGTLQYMAPERARGQGSHHSDIFSVGAVFYELLTNRAPFPGNDPIEILEKLRSQDPPPLSEVEPSLPPELGKILERALQKEPARRFATLGDMRTELQRLRRRIGEDAERLRRDLQGRLRRLHELREALESRLGGPWGDETLLAVDERAPLATLERVGRDTAARIERLQELLTQAETLRPALDRGLEALRNGEFERAVSELDRVVTEMPEHARAVESLRAAQHHVDAHNQRREQIAGLLRDARSAYDSGAYVRCLEVLGWAADSAAPAAPSAEAEALRHAAETALAREQADEAVRLEARRRALESAIAMRGNAERARRAAEVAAAARYQGPLWESAESKFAAALSGLAGEAFAQGERDFQEALQLYERAEAGAREAQAAAATAALARHTEAAAPAADTSDETVFVDTSTLMPERPAPAPVAAPVAAPPPTTTRMPQPVRAGTFGTPPSASDVGRVRPAPGVSPSVRDALSSVSSWVRALPRRYRTLSAAGALALALVAIVVWLSSGRDATRAKREGLEQLRGTVAAARDRAIKAEAPALAPESLSRAEAAQAEGERLSTGQDLAGAAQAYQAASDRYGEAEKQAQTRREQRTEADAARARMAEEKQRAAPDAADFARAAELERQASALYAQRSFGEATTSFRAAGELFAKALPPPAPVPVPAPVAPASTAPTPAPQSPAAAPSPADPRAQIRALLESYVRSAETKDVDLLRRIRPTLSDDELRRVRASNEIKRSHKVDLRVYDITVTGDEAQAQGRREDVVVLSSGQRIQTETRFTYTLKRGARGWVINEVRESTDRAPVETRPAPPRTPRRPEPVTR